jgi:phosphinothricin acetyltransferase
MGPEAPYVQVRNGVEGDLEAIVAIYNHYVRETAITFDTSCVTPEDRLPWLRSHPEDGPHRLLVAHSQDGAPDGPPAPGTDPEGGFANGTGRLLGWATSSPFRARAAYATSVEVSVYCAADVVGRGIGTLLYTSLFEALRGQDLHRAYAGITQPNDASTRLHAAFGFQHLGTYREVGRKFGRYWDVAWYEKPLDRDAT